jgi:ketosteroid isomerase-like protein
VTRIAASAGSLLLAVLGTCARPVDRAAARTALQDADRAFNHATAERRADGWTEFFAEDGAMIRPAGTITGQAAIREQMVKAFADTAFSLTWEPLRADVGAAGDLGYTIGRSEARFRNARGEVVVRTGRYLTVWKKQADGSWKVAQDIGVQDAGQGP